MTLKISFNPWIYLYDEVSNTQNQDRMQNLHPLEVNVSTSPIGVHKSFGISSPQVRVLDVYSFLIYYLCQKGF
jgi:hypothetical protein